ncbi:hypothetical protein LSTR_LSTR015387, partial [Laodelphax striatellus]
MRIYDDDGNNVTPKPLKFSLMKESIIGSKKSSCSLDSQASKSLDDKESQKSDDLLTTDAIAGIYAGYKKENTKCQILGKSEVVLVVRETPTTWLLDINGYVEQQLGNNGEDEEQQQATNSESTQDNVEADGNSQRTLKHSQCSASIDGRSVNEDVEPEEETEENRLNNLPAFDNAVLITERLLASNTYTKQQTEFAGFDSQKGCLRSGIHYHMSLLWTFTHEEFVNRTVTAISWNTGNQVIKKNRENSIEFNEKNLNRILKDRKLIPHQRPDFL